MLEKISIIIPSWKRSKNIKKILYALSKQNYRKELYEVIIVYSGNFLKTGKNYNINITYLNSIKNSNALKRNLGIKNSKYKNLIFLDDDCIPSKNFLFYYSRLFSKINEKEILNGSVTYNLKKGNELKYLKLRNQNHFKISNRENKFKLDISFKNIVTMNMALKKPNNQYIKIFDERFGSYGFEDYEFAYRFSKKKYKFLKASPLVVHEENRNYEAYLNKFYFLGRYSSKLFKNINYQAYRSSNYHTIEDNVITKFLKIVPFSNFLLFIINKIIYMITIKLFTTNILLKMNITFSYLIGYMDRNKKNTKHLNWYR